MFQINWKLKALLYKIFGFLQLKTIFYLIQKYVTKRSKIVINKIDKSWIHHAKYKKKNDVKNLLEVGAGKSLEQNIYISYKFNSSIEQTTIDINEMIDFDLLNQASEKISKILEVENKGKINNLKELKKFYNIEYRAPCLLNELRNDNKKFDICISTTTLEHFTVDNLKAYLIDLKYILSKNVLISSVIDYSDHYSHTDKNITPLNFLKYSKMEWEKFNNSYLFQNRLRHQDYIKIIEEGGYKIKEILKEQPLKAPKKISKEFDSENEETYIGSAYLLFETKVF